jgi:hypothetical protein
MSTITTDITAHSPAAGGEVSLTGQNLGHIRSRVSQSAYITGGLGMALALVLGLCEGDGMRHFWHSYLLAACFFASLSLGGLAFVALQHLTRAGWSVVVRRLAEIFAANIGAVGLLFIPILLNVLCGSSALYIWNDAQLAQSDELIRQKVPYLNAGFFVLRSVLYFVVWTYLARRFLALSTAQDRHLDPQITLRLEALSAPTLLIFALTITFASIDWMMSLDPHWFSSIFGIYYFSGCMVGFLAAVNLVLNLLQRQLNLMNIVTADHRHDLGKLLFGFMCFWAYIGFSQFLLIWYANIPEETVWFKIRQSDGWIFVSFALMIGHFLLPFLGLMPRAMKRDPKVLATWSLVLLIMHAVDLYWLIFPTFEIEGPTLPLLSLSCLMGLGGLYVAAWLSVAGSNSLVPLNDPRLPESLATHNL